MDRDNRMEMNHARRYARETLLIFAAFNGALCWVNLTWVESWVRWPTATLCAAGFWVFGAYWEASWTEIRRCFERCKTPHRMDVIYASPLTGGGAVLLALIAVLYTA